MTRRLLKLIGKVCRFIVALYLFVSLSVGTAGAYPGFFIRPPFNGTYIQTSFFDHHYPNYYYDGYISIFNGDKKPNEDPYWYHGHPGIDWGMCSGTDILAVANGIVRYKDARETGLGPYGRYLIIEHEDGYFSLYAHLETILVSENSIVKNGDHIAESGNTGSSSGAHLHFGIYHGGWEDGNHICCGNEYPTDPFGWADLQGNPDPLQTYTTNPHTATCLWRSRPVDNISCYEILREDKGFYFSVDGDYNEVDNWGYGAHSYAYRENGSPLRKAVWQFSGIPSAFYLVYAWIPPGTISYPNSSVAIYTIHTGLSNHTVTINQVNQNGGWILLGGWAFSGNNNPSIELNPPGVGSGTKYIRADAMKLRTSLTFIPFLTRNEPTQ